MATSERLQVLAMNLALKTTALLGLLLLALGCQPSPETERRTTGITMGIADPHDRGVVSLLVRGLPGCTGTLVTPDVLVTAAHCLPAPSALTVIVGEGASATEVPVADVLRHPAFHPFTLANDVGAVLLGRPVPEAQTWPLMRQPFDESFVGTPVRLVGFGKLGADDDSPSVRRQGIAAIARFDEGRFWLTANPSQTCRGDSGGPAFVMRDGVEYLAGVTSAGDLGCAHLAIETRVDAHVAGFLQPLLDRAGRGERLSTADAGAGPPEREPERRAVGCRYARGGRSLGLLSALLAPALFIGLLTLVERMNQRRKKGRIT